MEVGNEEHYEAIGVMSGSSLDGLDLAWCTFRTSKGHWSFNIREARTVPYSPEFKARLANVMLGSAVELARIHRDLGSLIGKACRDLLDGNRVDLIGSHGHTIFHKPKEGLTTQIGCGARIAAATSTTTVCDFRTMDVALGGQGAPLVPLGEKLLFPDHRAFLNIGGICNIALHGADRVIGYDVCIGNQALNFLAEETGLPYDTNGDLARSGKVDVDLLDRLNNLPFHSETPPRTLGREWFEEEIKPLISDRAIPLANRSCTAVEHIATMIATSLRQAPGTVLTTGGGAHNGFLIERIRALSDKLIEVPNALTVDFKEALIFALLGVRRWRNGTTALGSVTGASRDSVGGAVYSHGGDDEGKDRP